MKANLVIYLLLKIPKNIKKHTIICLSGRLFNGFEAEIEHGLL